MLNYEAKASTSLVVELSVIQLPQGGKRVVVSRDTGTRAIKQAAVSLQGGHTAPSLTRASPHLTYKVRHCTQAKK